MQTRMLSVMLVILGVSLSACQLFHPKVVFPEPSHSVPEIQITSTSSGQSKIFPLESTRVVPEIQLTPIPSPSPAIITDQPLVPAQSSYQSGKAVQPTIVPATLALPENIQPGFLLAIPRTRHTATLLKNGKILIIGGSVEGDDFALDEEIIDPRTGKSKWTAPMHTPRHDHTATLLPDGRVLVVGGYNLEQQWLSDAEVYDPRSDTWTVIPPYYPHGTAHTATLMQNGKVLVVGGCIGSGVCTNAVEIFDSHTNLWSPAEFLVSERGGHTAQSLFYGGVLIIGGSTGRNEIPSDGSALIYYSSNNTWYATRPMIIPRAFSQSITLDSGKILVTGGILIGSTPPKTTNTAEIYDPRTYTWREVSPLSKARFAFMLVPFSKTYHNRQVAAISGTGDWEGNWTAASFVTEIEVFDPATEQWRIAEELPDPSAFSTITQLADGRLWIAGGQTANTVTDTTWLIEIQP